jgi:hypothetical protein
MDKTFALRNYEMTIWPISNFSHYFERAVEL